MSGPPAPGIKISVCLPTYNNAEFLGKTLDSILPQAGEEIEVIVHDGCSSDRTAELMADYARRWPRLRYHRSARPDIFDANMSNCVALAQGEYFWLFGDDVMRPDAIARALERIKDGDDVYLLEHTLCSKEMAFESAYPMFSPNVEVRADLSDPAARREWFRRALTTEPFFSFMSSLLVRREKWRSGNAAKELYGLGWGHVAQLFSLIPGGLKVCYASGAWLDRRGSDNASSAASLVKLFGVFIDGYQQIVDTTFGRESEEAFHVRRVIRGELGLRLFLFVKTKCRGELNRENRVRLDALFRKAYGDKTAGVILTRFLYAAVPLWLYDASRSMKRLIKGSVS